MREDMFKVIVERPRAYAGYHRRGRPLPIDEDSPSRGKVKPLEGRKSLNENLAPLRRFLEKSVGRPWDKVFSEICERLSIASAVQKHVRDHLEDFVQLSPVPTCRWRNRPGGLYVCPRTGILRRRPLPRVERSAAPLTSIRIDAVWTYELVNELWFRVRWTPADETPGWDVLLKKLVTRSSAPRRAVEKWQCGKKELAFIRAC
jgi:hypothetical protein